MALFAHVTRGLLRLSTPVVIVSAVMLARAQEPAPKTQLSYADARPILVALRGNLPGALRSKTPAALEDAWPDWVRRRDAEIRARLERGDEDSLVNLWLYGTSFTTLPPARDADLAARRGGQSLADVLEARLEDLIDGVASPGTNERLLFARQFLERRGIDPRTAAGRARTRRVLVDARARVLAEYAGYDRAVESARRLGDPGAAAAANATLFSDRGLSSDTSILSNYAVERALETLAASKVLASGSVRRVAIVGPGLDFINKSDGYDFYPQQTMQPFALIDSLLRFGLASAGDLRVTTFDLSPRVNHHVASARDRADAGHAYVVNIPLARDERWHPDLVAYWERFGALIGERAEAAVPPGVAGRVDVRALGVRPAIVRSIVPRDVNIVLERLDPLAADERFDLVVATNVFVYYDLFEQALALANVASMLRPAGVLLANSAVFPTPPMKSQAGVLEVAYSERQSDYIFWYQKE